MEQCLLWHPPLEVHCFLLQQLGAPLALLALLAPSPEVNGVKNASLQATWLGLQRRSLQPKGFVPLANPPPMSLHACPIQALEEWRHP